MVANTLIFNSMNTQLNIVQDNGDVWSDMADDQTNPCKSCGVCCHHFRISFYQGECVSNGGIVPDDLVIPITPFHVAMKGTEAGGKKCVALNGEIGNNIGCSIYSNRPSVCRLYHVWDDQGNPNPKCQELRAKYGIQPLQKQTC